MLRLALAFAITTKVGAIPGTMGGITNPGNAASMENLESVTIAEGIAIASANDLGASSVPDPVVDMGDPNTADVDPDLPTMGAAGQMPNTAPDLVLAMDDPVNGANEAGSTEASTEDIAIAPANEAESLQASPENIAISYQHCCGGKDGDGCAGIRENYRGVACD